MIRHTIPIRINPQKNLPVPVTFTADGDTVVAGGTNRGARVLDSRTSETTQFLPHDGVSRSIPVQFDSIHTCVQVILYNLSFVSVQTCPAQSVDDYSHF